MSEPKIYNFGTEASGSNMLGLIAPFLQQRGIDPGVVAAMMSNCRNNGFNNEGSWFIWIIFLFFLMGWNRNGFGGNNGGDYPLANMLNNDTARELFMSAIQGNGTAINQLATTLNRDVNAIQSAINSVQSQICQVGNQVGLTGQQVINSIQQGNMSIANQLATCCCDIRESVTRMGYENQIANLNQTNQLTAAINSVATGQERGFSQLGYATQQQTCDLQNTFNSGVQKIIDGQAAAERREMQAIISKQGDEISTYKTANIVGQQIAPFSAALASLQKEIADIKCAQPSTITLPNPTAVAVPACNFFSGYNNPYQYGFWG